MYLSKQIFSESIVKRYVIHFRAEKLNYFETLNRQLKLLKNNNKPVQQFSYLNSVKLILVANLMKLLFLKY